MPPLEREQISGGPAIEPRRAPYGRREAGGAASRSAGASQPYAGQTYYGRPAVKPSRYGWLIVAYFFVGGLAGAAQLIATLADLLGGRSDRSIVRAGRYLALAGSLISPVLLIADLHVPQRWYNMLRIFRKTSAMSIGAWTLMAFGSLSGLAALAQVLDDLLGLRAARWLGRAAGVPAAAAGMLMTTYSGALLSATSIPLWAAANRWLAALFGASSFSSAGAALSLLAAWAGAPRGALRRLGAIGLASAAAELVLSAATDQEWRRAGVAAPIEREPLRSAYRIGALGIGVGVPLALNAAQIVRRRPSRAIAVLSAVAALAGGFVLRAVLVFAGNASGRRPEDYFRFTQPRVDTNDERGAS